MKSIIFLLPTLLFANFSLHNYNKELHILESFDIEPSFLYDVSMKKIREKRSSVEERKYFFQTLKSASIFIPTMKKILNINHIPDEFIYLPMVESDFEMQSLSNKSAVGLWQFIPQTAKDYHLKIDRFVDERKDIIKSTQAASQFLKQLHKKFGKWYLAAIAYNCGPTRLTNGIKKAGSDKLSVLLDERHHYIPKESKRYIRKIVAFALIGNDEKLFIQNNSIHLLNVANAYSLSTVYLPGGESLKRVAQILDMPLKKLQKINRHLKCNFIPPYVKKYNIYIPYEKLALFKQKYFRVHIVKNGEDLKSISQKYKVNFKYLMSINHLKNFRLKLHQRLFIPLYQVVNV